ncbi:MAG: dihydroorotate dehydrogenase electron transfer subunit [Oscillospiraceae bacterium]|nr:dihydroorotate dehydrogenase electron transfer subunit [Oscillospiraceae bacterium]MBQ3985895.1 dihydroorotate dehydrogenase electron transfer subunit [Oscillospiraceae bacterium]
MREEIFCVEANDVLTENVYRLTLSGNTEGIVPGQFVNIALDGLYLRRPISVADAEENRLTLIYKAVGKGTEQMSGLLPGDYLDILTCLGNGYCLESSGDHPLLIGGGVGIPPLYYLAKRLREAGKEVSVILGFNNADEVFYEDEFSQLDCDVKVTTVDGSYGVKGFATDALTSSYSYFYTCGPAPMLKSVYYKTNTSGEFSFEERMGCGFGACMGCSKKTVSGFKRVCKDGPVFRKEEILWED